MEEDREPKIKPTHLWSIFDKGSMTTQRWKDSLRQMVLGKLDRYM